MRLPCAKEPKVGKFIDPLTDWGFRHLFGQEPNKEILKEFLNDLFQGEKHIAEPEYALYERDGDNGEPLSTRWSFLQNSAKQPNIGKIVDDRMDAIESANAQLKGILPIDHTQMKWNAEESFLNKKRC